MKRPKLFSLQAKIDKLIEFDKSYLEVRNRMEISKQIHENSVELFKSAIKRHNIQVDYADPSTENDKILNGLNDYNFVWSLGGDGHFLRISNYIKNDTLPLIGINTDPDRSEGFLWNFKIKKEYGVNELDYLMEKLKNVEKSPAHYRTRILVQNHRLEEKMLESLSLNEIILEESYGAKTWLYGMNVDDKIQFNLIKSSGLIVATGSGSTGLLLSARRPRVSQLKSIMNDNNESRLNKLKQINTELRIKGDSKKFYYFNRELWLPFSKVDNLVDSDLKTLEQIEEGFCRSKLTVTNHSLDANILIDGAHKFKIEYGDIIRISLGSSLKCISG